jgi:ankyrin repeat protein
VQNQSTPLLYAAANGHASVVKLLVERGADINATNATVRSNAPWPLVRGRRGGAAHSNRRRYARTRAAQCVRRALAGPLFRPVLR